MGRDCAATCLHELYMSRRRSVKILFTFYRQNVLTGRTSVGIKTTRAFVYYGIKAMTSLLDLLSLNMNMNEKF